jgi:hypothetical protein
MDESVELCGALGSRLNGVRQLPSHPVANFEYFCLSPLVLGSSQPCLSVPLAVSHSRHSILNVFWITDRMPRREIFLNETYFFLRPCAMFRNMISILPPRPTPML